jgi:UDP-N-acetyl-D-galactosamine dehydrogenase
VILSGRRVNDGMGMFVANKVVKLMIAKNHKINLAKVLILGITFKEDCPDIRNSKVIDIYSELKQFGLQVDVFDPHADSEEVHEEYCVYLIENPLTNNYDAVIMAVSHKEFLNLDIKALCKSNDSVIFDTKSFLDRATVDARL